MNALPVFNRELRILARSPSVFWVRLGVGGLAAVVGTAQFLRPAQGAAVAAVGQATFHGLAAGAFVLATVSCLLTSDVLAAERRAGMLQLLRLTRVRSLDIILGKLASVGIHSAYALGAFLPILMLPVLAGGVSGLSAVCMGLAVANQLFVALAAGLAASARRSEHFKTSRDALAVVLCLQVLPIAGAELGWRAVALASPLKTALIAAEPTLTMSLRPFFTSLAVVHALGWLLIVVSTLRLGRSMASPLDVLPVRRIQRSPREEADLPLVHRRRWVSALDHDRPIEWVVYWRQQVRGTVWLTALMALALAGWAPVFRYASTVISSPMPAAIAFPAEAALGIAGAAVVAWMAARLFVEARQSGELEALLTTPAGAENLVAEQATLLRRLYPLPVLLMQIPLLPWVLSEPLRTSFIVAQGVKNLWACYFPFTILLQLANTFLMVQALCWVGVWLGLSCQSRTRVVLWTVFLGKGLPLLLLMAGWAAFDLTKGEILSRYWLTWCVPQLLVTGYCLWLVHRAKSVLAQGAGGPDVQRASMFQNPRRVVPAFK